MPERDPQRQRARPTPGRSTGLDRRTSGARAARGPGRRAARRVEGAARGAAARGAIPSASGWHPPTIPRRCTTPWASFHWSPSTSRSSPTAAATRPRVLLRRARLPRRAARLRRRGPRPALLPRALRLRRVRAARRREPARRRWPRCTTSPSPTRARVDQPAAPLPPPFADDRRGDLAMSLDLRIDRARKLLAGRREELLAPPRSPRASAPRTWWCSTSSRATASRSRSSRSTPGACRSETHALIDKVRQRLRARRSTSTRRGPTASRPSSPSTASTASTTASSSARRAAPCARSSRCAARSPASAAGSPACAASSPTRAPTLAESELDAGAGLWKFNPLADWTDDDVWAYLRAQPRALQRAARPRLPVDRLRAVHARRASPGEHPRAGPLVVGAGRREEGMRAARDPGHGRERMQVRRRSKAEVATSQRVA